MAAIASALPSTAAAASSSSSSASSVAGLAASDSLANEQTFLQLLVAQLKNQDPSNPMDGTQFVTQLAEFSQLEQQLAMRQDLDKMAGSITTAAASNGSSGNSGSD
ncbi:MAG: flagellar hook capping FlgD N-terminal domain-containing protein [Bryobacteraceae bacterium]|jgi:flagellar basal-body rod modification protein FlgD